MGTGTSFVKRVNRRLKRDFNWVSRRLLHPVPMAHAADMPHANFREIFPAEPFDMIRPDGFNDTDWRVFQAGMQPVVPATRLIDIADAHVIEHDSWIFDKDGTAILGLWDPQGRMTEKQRIYAIDDTSPERLQKTEHLAGTSLLLNQVVAGNFYHFVNQIMPRLKIASEVIPLDQIDHFITPDNTTGFMRELLQCAGIDLDKVRPVTEAGHRCDRLIATSNPGPHHVPPVWANDYLQSIAPDTPSPIKAKRIFVSRVDAPKRRLLNHDKVEALLDDHGFEHIGMSGRSIAEQVAIFREAEIIVAVHGAALAHLVFCRPGTKVIELLPRNHLQPCFWTIGQMMDLDHSIVLSTEKPLPVQKWRHDVNADLHIDLGELTNVLNSAIAARKPAQT